MWAHHLNVFEHSRPSISVDIRYPVVHPPVYKLRGIIVHVKDVHVETCGKVVVQNVLVSFFAKGAATPKG